MITISFAINQNKPLDIKFKEELEFLLSNFLDGYLLGNVIIKDDLELVFDDFEIYYNGKTMKYYNGFWKTNNLSYY